MKKILSTVLAMFILILPGIALAAETITDIGDASEATQSVIASLVPLFIGFGLLLFLWGVFMYLVNGHSEEQRSESRQYMIWGIVGLTVMVSVWGLVSMLSSLTGIPIVADFVPKLPTTQMSLICSRQSFATIIGCVVNFVQNDIAVILMGLALIVFLWGVVKFIKGAGEEDARTEGKQFMFYGILGLFVMLTMWSLVAILASSLFGNTGSYLLIPQL